jgi:hypothetical protein
MPKKNPLTRYTEVKHRMMTFMEENASFFATYNRLQQEEQEAEKDVRDYAREQGENIENEEYIVKYIPAKRQGFDWQTIRHMATDKELRAIEANALKSVSLDAKAMQKLVLDGLIHPSIVQKSYFQTDDTPRIQITVKHS